MDAAEASTFNKAVDWYVLYIESDDTDLSYRYKGRGHWFSPPTIQYINGIPTITTTEPDQWPALPRSLESDSTSSDTSWSVRFPTLQAIYDTRSRQSSPLAEYYRSYIRSTLQRLTQDEGKRFGALVMEPVCLGAGGMVFVDPLFQACIIGVVRTSSDLLGVTPSPDSASYDSQRAALRSRPADHWEGLPVVYDEGTFPYPFIRFPADIRSLLRPTPLRLLLRRHDPDHHPRHLRLRQNPHRRSPPAISHARLEIHL